MSQSNSSPQKYQFIIRKTATLVEKKLYTATVVVDDEDDIVIEHESGIGCGKDYVQNNHKCSEAGCSRDVYVLYPWNRKISPCVELKDGEILWLQKEMWGKHSFCSDCINRLITEFKE
tara:strand:+ start:168 stop:521 length:354 start_codon:yes stop_codon:yes gene_type:complete